MTDKEFAKELVDTLQDEIQDLQLRSKGTDFNFGYIEALSDIVNGLKKYLEQTNA